MLGVRPQGGAPPLLDLDLPVQQETAPPVGGLLGQVIPQPPLQLF